MAKNIAVSDLAAIPAFQVRVRDRLMAHALDIASKPPATGEEGIAQAANQVIQNSANSAMGGPVSLIVASQLGGNYDATDADITKAINDRKWSVYNTAQPPVVVNTAYDPDLNAYARNALIAKAQDILESEDAKQIELRPMAKEIMGTLDEYQRNIVALSVPKLTKDSTVTERNTAIKAAIKSLVR